MAVTASINGGNEHWIEMRRLKVKSPMIEREYDCAKDPAPCIMAGGMDGAGISQHQVDGPSGALGEPRGYRVPAMAEVRAAEKTNGLRVASTFSGCGGSSLGWRMAGYEVAWANEFIPAARAVYMANSDAHVCSIDIREVDAARILKEADGPIDVFEGSPPCDSFSSAGKRDKKWNKEKSYYGKKQRTDDLFFEYSRLVGELRPLVFVAENVAGMVRGRAKGRWMQIRDSLMSHGYKVVAKILDAQWLGVPQRRTRVIVIGVRDDLGLEPAFPQPQRKVITIADALGWPSSSDVERRVLAGNSSFTERLVSGGGVPSPTILASGGKTSGLMEEQQGGAWVRRRFTIPELKRLCAFPDDFELSGSYAKQWARLGLSVPPLMMKAIAESIEPVVLEAKARGFS